jgi:hypothetical protein
MLLLILLVLYLVCVSLILLLPALWVHEIYNQYSGSRPVTCPENQQQVAVRIDSRHAAATGMNGRPELRLSDCTRWPERSKCGQECLSQAVQAKPYTLGEVKMGTKQIYHLPIILAAFAAWCLGAVWHSQYVFRTQWMDAIGLTRTQIKQMLWWYSPHLLTVAICLLFAYGVAWLLAVRHRKGVLQGMLTSLLLCGAVVAANWYGIAELPHDLVMIEAGYTVLAALTVGTIVGGLYDKLLLRPQ